MFQIQKIAQGLAGQLGIFQTGEGPKALLEELRGTVDLGAHYLARDISTANTITDPASAIGDSAIVTVPAGETWKVIGAGYTATNSAAGCLVDIGFDFIPGQGSLALPLAQQLTQARTLAAANQVASSGILFPQPIIVQAGSGFRARLQVASTTGTIRLICIAAFWRITQPA